MIMITQKPILVKIDCYTLDELDKFVSSQICPNRNKAINAAIRMYLQFQRLRHNGKPEAGKYDNFIFEWASRI